MGTPRGGWAMLLAVAMVISYNSWVLASLNSHPAPLSGYISELAAADQPYSWVFRTGDFIAGAFMVLIGALGRTGWRHVLGRYSVWTAVALTLAGAATIVDAVLNIPCAPTFDAVCYASYVSDPMGPGFAGHTIASVVVTIGLFATLFLAARGRRSVRGGTGQARLIFAVAVLMLGLALGTWVVELLLQVGQGYVQLFSILLASVSIGWLGHAAVLGYSPRRGIGVR